MRSQSYERALAAAPHVLQPSWLTRLGYLGVVVLVLAALAGMAMDLQLAPGIMVAGLGKLGRFAHASFPPSDGGHLVRILRAIVETFAMAFAGTVLAAVAAAPLGLIGAKTVVSQPVIHFAFRRVLDWLRGVPSLVWALILVSAFGLGPFGGVVALALADLPRLAKLFSEAIENGDERPMDGVRAAGVSPLMALRYGLAPQVAPVIASQCLFFLESNFRNAAVLGIVGAGGIGFELQERIRVFAFDEAAFIIILYMVCVAVLDTFSQRLRASLA
jgi:phosphonate transport system permease protein